MTGLPPSLTAEGIVGGVFSVIHSRLLEGDREPLLMLLNPLMSMIVLPYLGSAAARRELEPPLPERAIPKRDSEPLTSDPFKDAGMRLTYRTVRVLMAIADHPGASNRFIGETAGMVDQGQISKLLGRLQRIGLISNTGLGPGKGAPNAWSLTDRGGQVVHAIRSHSEDSR
jgi:DNA-binding MarR family transcriptional regulator